MILTTGTAIDATRDGSVQPLGNVLQRVLQNRGLARQPFLADSDGTPKPETGFSAPKPTSGDLIAGLTMVPDRSRFVRA